MRVISGYLRSRQIIRPASSRIRPTKDRVREAVFNIIAPEVPGSSFLDLFSGSGAFSFEALSRGASSALAVDNDPQAIDAIRKNIARLGLSEKIETRQSDVFEQVGTLSKTERTFGLIFADPPYATGLARKTLNMIGVYDILVHSGILVIEHSQKERFEEVPSGFSLYKQKTYGKVAVSFFQRHE